MAINRCAAICLGFAAASWTSSAHSAAIIDFELIDPGTVYGVPGGHLPGELVLSQDGIDVFVADFLFNSTPYFALAEVGGRFDYYFPTTPLSIDNISFRFNFVNVGFDVDQVTIAYQEFGGIDNFSVNGGPIIELPQLALLPSDIAPGVNAAVDEGVITLTGPVTEFLIGGQELGIDDIVAVPEPASLALLALGAACALRRRRRPGR